MSGPGKRHIKKNKLLLALVHVVVMIIARAKIAMMSENLCD